MQREIGTELCISVHLVLRDKMQNMTKEKENEHKRKKSLRLSCYCQYLLTFYKLENLVSPDNLTILTDQHIQAQAHDDFPRIS